MTDDARQIENLLYTYAERIDAGDLDGVAQMFAHGRICGRENGPPETVFTGTAGVRAMYAMAVKLHDDGTPKTKHHIVGARIEVDDAAGTATSTANYLVTQATPELPLQVIVTGHYRDTFHRVDGAWCFDTRIMFIDQLGDVSQHLAVRRPG